MFVDRTDDRSRRHPTVECHDIRRAHLVSIEFHGDVIVATDSVDVIVKCVLLLRRDVTGETERLNFGHSPDRTRIEHLVAILQVRVEITGQNLLHIGMVDHAVIRVRRFAIVNPVRSAEVEHRSARRDPSSLKRILRHAEVLFEPFPLVIRNRIATIVSADEPLEPIPANAIPFGVRLPEFSLRRLQVLPRLLLADFARTGEKFASRLNLRESLIADDPLVCALRMGHVACDSLERLKVSAHHRLVEIVELVLVVQRLRCEYPSQEVEHAIDLVEPFADGRNCDHRPPVRVVCVSTGDRLVDLDLPSLLAMTVGRHLVRQSRSRIANTIDRQRIREPTLCVEVDESHLLRRTVDRVADLVRYGMTLRPVRQCDDIGDIRDRHQVLLAIAPDEVESAAPAVVPLDVLRREVLLLRTVEERPRTSSVHPLVLTGDLPSVGDRLFDESLRDLPIDRHADLDRPTVAEIDIDIVSPVSVIGVVRDIRRKPCEVLEREFGVADREDTAHLRPSAFGRDPLADLEVAPNRVEVIPPTERRVVIRHRLQQFCRLRIHAEIVADRLNLLRRSVRPLDRVHHSTHDHRIPFAYLSLDSIRVLLEGLLHLVGSLLVSCRTDIVDLLASLLQHIGQRELVDCVLRPLHSAVDLGETAVLQGVVRVRPLPHACLQVRAHRDLVSPMTETGVRTRQQCETDGRISALLDNIERRLDQPSVADEFVREPQERILRPERIDDRVAVEVLDGVSVLVLADGEATIPIALRLVPNLSAEECALVHDGLRGHIYGGVETVVDIRDLAEEQRLSACLRRTHRVAECLRPERLNEVRADGLPRLLRECLRRKTDLRRRRNRLLLRPSRSDHRHERTVSRLLHRQTLRRRTIQLTGVERKIPHRLLRHLANRLDALAHLSDGLHVTFDLLVDFYDVPEELPLRKSLLVGDRRVRVSRHFRVFGARLRQPFRRLAHVHARLLREVELMECGVVLRLRRRKTPLRLSVNLHGCANILRCVREIDRLERIPTLADFPSCPHEVAEEELVDLADLPSVRHILRDLDPTGSREFAKAADLADQQEAEVVAEACARTSPKVARIGNLLRHRVPDLMA